MKLAYFRIKYNVAPTLEPLAGFTPPQSASQYLQISSSIRSQSFGKVKFSNRDFDIS